LRRSDVTDHSTRPAAAAYARPRAERKSAEVWHAPREAAKAGLTKLPVKKEPKLSLVDEEDVLLEDVFDDDIENKDAAVKKGPPRRSRKSTLGSIGNVGKDQTKPSPRRTTLGSIGSLQGKEEVVFHQDKKAEATKSAAARAPKKSKKVLTLPMTPVDNVLSPSIPKSTGVSPFPLPPGVVCIDLDDGSEATYFGDIVDYTRAEEELYADDFNYTNWKLSDLSQARSEKTRAVLFDWIIEVVHYFKAGQETLYNAVHLIDRYVTSNHNSIRHMDIQLVGATAVLLATKLEEYYAADIKMLVKLTQHSVTDRDIRRMELDIMRCLDFNTYCLDPMIFLNRFIRAAFKQEDRMFIEACCFFLDATVPVTAYWALKTSKKCAAAVYAALCLVKPSTTSDEPLWTPTLVYYTGYSKDRIYLLARQMLGLLEKTLAVAPGEDCGIRVKYNSHSRHSAFLKSDHCSQTTIDNAVYLMTHERTFLTPFHGHFAFDV